MLRSRPDLCARRGSRISRCPQVNVRAGFTLVELIFSMTILAFTTAILGGLMLAIGSAWDHSSNLEDSRRQAQVTLNRIKWMVHQSGTYRLSGQSTVVGLAVIPTAAGFYQAPSTLVVWSGGSSGGMSAQGLQSRLPVASELVIYMPDASTPSRFVEVTFPSDTTSVDLASASLSTTIQTLLQSNTRQTILLCDRLQVTSMQAASTIKIGNSRFELSSSPSDFEIGAVTAGSQAWNALSWGQGLVSSDRGLRTTNVRIELLLDPNPKSPATDSSGYSTAIPFLGSVNRQYVYQK